MAQKSETATTTKTTTASFKELQEAFMKTLYDEQGGKLVELLARVEAKTNVKREQFVYGFGGLFVIYMIFGYFAQLVCNTIGFAYPAYASVKAIRTENKDDDTQWLIYWTVFAVFSLLDFFGAKIMHFFPLYWLLKCAFLLYLYLPQFHGAQRLYHDIIDPAVVRLEHTYKRHRAAGASNRKPTGVVQDVDEAADALIDK